jgi:Fe(3+) dicitrate transport protein
MKEIKKLIYVKVLLLSIRLVGQNSQIDTFPNQKITETTIKAYKEQTIEVKQLPTLHGTYLVAGIKNQVLNIADLNANLTEKAGRQIFAKVPGVFVYDMDGSGNQVNIATRGLDPHRSWEYNLRQNGVMMNSDIYGYPASHYSPPMESIQKIELISGTAGLQYGAQFGGMINYITKTGDTTKAIAYDGSHTAGSFDLWSTYNALAGKIGKISYYTYYQKRVSDGYRNNSRSVASAQYAHLNYQISSKINLNAALGRSTYLYKLAGPLTDAMFLENPRQSTRNRNYFNPDIYLPSLTFDWKLNERTQLQIISSAVLGVRNSLQFIAFANVADTIQSDTKTYKNRQVDIDNFNSRTSEIRLSHQYSVLKMPNIVVTGLRYINNDLHRRQLGKGSSGTDFDLSITGDFGRDMHCKTQNIAFFVENYIKTSSKLSITTGFRLENGTSKMSGKIDYLTNPNFLKIVRHSFPLFGINGQYDLGNKNRLYAGFSQAYRPVIFSDIIPPTNFDRSDPNLRDATGYNAELGISGAKNALFYYDLTCFLLRYNDRIGSQALVENGETYILKSNIGNTLTRGIEFYAEYIPIKNNRQKISFFTSSSYFDGFYLSGNVVINNENKSIKGNRLETVPTWISRNGLAMGYKKMNATIQYSYVSKSFSDALNTQQPSVNGAKGTVPAYGVLDANASLRISKHFTIKAGVNNLTNQQYFTKRPAGYPGVGVWGSDGRSFQTSLGIRF